MWRKDRLSLILITLVLLSGILSAPSLAGTISSQGAGGSLTKHETVYATLHGDGSISEIHVVNSFTGTEGEVVDFGDYEAVVNLTNTLPPVIDGERITFPDVQQTPFYYQGKMRKPELPWQFHLGYELDGQEVESSTLSGAQGHLRMTIGVEPNENAAGFFLEHYLIQIAVPLKMNQVSDVFAPAATPVIIGQFITISFSLLPGETGQFVIEADVRDFELHVIEITAVKSNLSMVSADEITDGFDKLSDGMKGMIDGTTQLKKGMTDLADGIGSLHNGMVEFNSGLGKLVEGVNAYQVGLSEFNTGLSTLRNHSREIAGGISGASAGSVQLLEGYVSIEDGLSDMLANKEQLTGLAYSLSESPDPSTRALAEAMLMQLHGIESLAGGMAQLNMEYAAFSDGLGNLATHYVEFDTGVEGATTAGAHLEEGFVEINKGILQSKKGVDDFQDGTGRLAQETATIPASVQLLLEGLEEMDAGITDAKNQLEGLMTGAETDETVSFVAPGKAFPDSVQFVIRTSYPEDSSDTHNTGDEEEDRNNIWQRLVALFANWF